jgi:hypothetical protein
VVYAVQQTVEFGLFRFRKLGLRVLRQEVIQAGLFRRSQDAAG